MLKFRKSQTFGQRRIIREIRLSHGTAIIR